MAKKKNRKLPMIGVLGYLTLDELFEQLYEYIEDSSNFKSTISGDRIPIEFKGAQPFTYKPNITTVQSMNGIPRFKDNTNGVYRRIRVIKFNHQYPDTPDGRLIKSKYIKYLLSRLFS